MAGIQTGCAATVESVILLHLKLWERPPPGKAGLEATNDADQYPDLIYEPFDDGWPGYEESVTATW